MIPIDYESHRHRATQWLNLPHKNHRQDLQHGPEGT
jgi:hypothetical protein